MYEIEQLLTLKSNCTIPGTDRTGKYSRNQCVATKDSPEQKICLTDNCESFYCCENAEPPEQMCVPIKNKINSLTEFISKPCYDTIRNTAGTCRPSNKCSKLFNKEAVSCGSECCTEFVCCPDDDLSLLSLPQQSRFIIGK